MQGRQGELLIHEMFHRIQPQLDLLFPDLPNNHLDTPDGRYWMQLEWKALSRALGSSGDIRLAAVRDALAFRAARRGRFPGAVESERILAINEGLAQYTAIVVAAASPLGGDAQSHRRARKGSHRADICSPIRLSGGSGLRNPAGWIRPGLDRGLVSCLS
jgi:hypothetical protein